MKPERVKRSVESHRNYQETNTKKKQNREGRQFNSGVQLLAAHLSKKTALSCKNRFNHLFFNT